MKRGCIRGSRDTFVRARATPLSTVEGRSVGSARLANSTTLSGRMIHVARRTSMGPLHFHAPAIRRSGAPQHGRYGTPSSSPKSGDLLRLRAPSSRSIPWVQIERLAPEVKVDVPKHSRARAQNVAPFQPRVARPSRRYGRTRARSLLLYGKQKAQTIVANPAVLDGWSA